MIELFNKYLENRCTPTEVAQLLVYFNLPENEILLRERIQEILQHDHAELSSGQDMRIEQTLTEIRNEIAAQKTEVISIRLKPWMKVAAGIILLAALFSLYRYYEKPKVEPVTAIVTKQDKLPGYNKAILLLSNGSKVMLDSSFTGGLGQQGAAKVSNARGQLSYNALKEMPEALLMNTVITPRGGQYQVLLSDGTKVWLNAESSLRYPVVFIGKVREVELTGEGYFEVAKNKSMPFKVNVSGKEDVEVLGTHFNINSYADEQILKTTLLEGSVKISTSTYRQMLKPGEQALVDDKLNIKVDTDVDLEEVVAWKNGKFMFKSADLKTILNQVARWYDVNIIYNGAVKEQFSGEISRNVNMSELFGILEATQKIKLDIHGNNVTVSAAKQ